MARRFRLPLAADPQTSSGARMCITNKGESIGQSIQVVSWNGIEGFGGQKVGNLQVLLEVSVHRARL